jgi:hypothetical protein
MRGHELMANILENQVFMRRYGDNGIKRLMADDGYKMH